MDTIKRNADGTYTVAGMIKCLSEAAALALLEDVGVIVDPLTIEADRRHTVYGSRTAIDPVSRMPFVELTVEHI